MSRQHPLKILSNVWLTDLVSGKTEGKKKPQIHFNQLRQHPQQIWIFFYGSSAAGIHEIEQGSFEKVVLSRTLACRTFKQL